MSAVPPQNPFRPTAILEAHRFLTCLLNETASQVRPSADTLTWLEERGLIEEVMTDAFDLEFIITPRGRQAMLGQHAA